jgi:hypothetical protein
VIGWYGEPVSNGIEWIEEAPNPLAHSSRARNAFLAYAFERFQNLLPRNTRVRFERVLVCSRCVIVTMWFLPMVSDEVPHCYRYWWICER